MRTTTMQLALLRTTPAVPLAFTVLRTTLTIPMALTVLRTMPSMMLALIVLRTTPTIPLTLTVLLLTAKERSALRRSQPVAWSTYTTQAAATAITTTMGKTHV